MPVGQHQERLYGPPGPQNSAVLMDIIGKLKKDLQKSRADNSKLVDQLNCLISLVKRLNILALHSENLFLCSFYNSGKNQNNTLPV